MHRHDLPINDQGRRHPVTSTRLAGAVLLLALGSAAGAGAEGQYDPFASKDPHERINAEHMRDAIEKGDWKGAAAFATTPALKRLYAQAQAELGKRAPAPVKK